MNSASYRAASEMRESKILRDRNNAGNKSDRAHQNRLALICSIRNQKYGTVAVFMLLES